MNRIRLSQHSPTAGRVSVGEIAGIAVDSPIHAANRRWRLRALVQWALEDLGWSLLRPLTDFLLLCLAVVLALGGLGHTVRASSAQLPLLGVPPAVMVLLYLRGLYRTRLRALILDGLVPVISSVSVAVMALAMAGVLIDGRAPDSSDWIRTWIFSLLALGIGRIVLSAAQRTARRHRYVGKPVLILGAGLVGSQVARRLDSHPEYGLRPIGFLDDDPRSIGEVGGRELPVLGTVADIDRTVGETGVKHLIVAFSSVTDARVSRLVQRCQDLGVDVAVVPRMFDTINHRVGYDTVGALPLMSFTAVDPRGLQFACKHAIDRVAAAAALLVLSPVMIAIALAVRITSPGPVLFRQRRVGRDGKLFDLYKFRSMREAPAQPGRAPATAAVLEEVGAFGTRRESAPRAPALELMPAYDTAPGGIEGEDRRTALGRLLRRTSLDELPQLLNVLRGEMSLIGPRPERPEFVELFRQDIVRYGDRHRVRSGITGWAQVHGLRGQTSLAERVEWDNYYITNWSLGLDLKIALLTFVWLFRNAE